MSTTFLKKPTTSKVSVMWPWNFVLRALALVPCAHCCIENFSSNNVRITPGDHFCIGGPFWFVSDFPPFWIKDGGRRANAPLVTTKIFSLKYSHVVYRWIGNLMQITNLIGTLYSNSAYKKLCNIVLQLTFHTVSKVWFETSNLDDS